MQSGRKDRHSKQRRPPIPHPKSKDSRHAVLCNYCGGKHTADRASCSAYGKSCNHYGKPNHFQAVCRRKKDKQNSSLSSSSCRRDVTADSDESAFMIEQVGAVHHNKKGQYFATLEFVSTSGKVVN